MGDHGRMVPDGPVEISAREAEVLAAIAAHRSNAQIAHAFHISIRTVESHVSSLLRKYGVTDRRQLADLITDTANWIPGSTGTGAAGVANVRGCRGVGRHLWGALLRRRRWGRRCGRQGW